MHSCHSLQLIRGEPEQAPNTRETGSGAWQQLNAHDQTPCGRLVLQATPFNLREKEGLVTLRTSSCAAGMQ